MIHIVYNCLIDFIAHIFSVFIDFYFSGSGFISHEFNIVWDYRSALLVLFSLINCIGYSPESRWQRSCLIP